jgi:D-alanine-D-alanine ligase-like ATP-grasp enzyme
MRTPFVTEMLKKLAPRVGATLLIEPEYGYVGQITFKNGRSALFRGTNFNINQLGSVEIARDKGYACFFLKSFGYNVPYGQTFFSDDLNQHLDIRRDIHDGFSFASQLGFPVIVKPNNLSQGRLVARVFNKREYFRLARQIFRHTSVLRVERFYEGNDYRIVVLDTEIISAYQRVPLSVVGDGRSTIRGLLRKKQESFVRAGRDTTIKIDDFRIETKLARQRLSLDSVLSRGTKLFLLDNANLSTGGDAFDVTADVHREFANLAVRITRDMGLRFCGVDIITADITRPVLDYVVIEVNGAPGLDNYASIGTKQAKAVELLYLRVLRALESDARVPWNRS